MSTALRDQLSLWREWVLARLGEVEAEAPGQEAGLERDLDRLVTQAPGLSGELRLLLGRARGVGRVSGQREMLRDAKENLGYFLEGGADPGRGEDLEFVTQSILDAQEDERHRTSIRIHDGPAQSLANVMMRLEFCQRLAARDGPEAAGELADVRRELDGVLQEIRRLIFDLRPMTLDDLGLIATMQRFVENERGRLPCDVSLEVQGAYERYSRGAETHIYRIAQEALRNAAVHGHPFRVRISLAIRPESLGLVVEDDGGGFDVTKTAPGRGISEIRRRVRALGGTVTWGRAAGGGCRVEVHLPARRLGRA